MLIDARTLPPGTEAGADVCVIGAGAAGITLAMELRDSGRSVLLLESGGDQPDPAVQDLYAGEIVGAPMRSIDRTLTAEELRLRYLGGTTNHWAGACRPLRPIDFEERPSLRRSGWPISHAELVPYWERAVEWVRISDAEFDPAAWADRLGVADRLRIARSDRLDTVAFQVTFPTSFRALYTADLEAAPAESLTVWHHANAVNLAMDDGPGGATRITGVDVRTLDGVALRVTARAYVLATGGIENARLLLASTDRDPAGVGNGRDQVGRHFCDHLQIYAGFGVLEADEAELAGYRALETTVPAGRHAGFAHAIRYGLSLSDDHLRDTGTTGLELLLAIGPYPGPAWRQSAGAGIDDVAAALRAQGGGPAAAVYVQGLAEQELDPDSRILLGDDTDALGMRRVRIDWRYSADDRARILAGLRVMAEELGALGWGRLQLVPGGVGFDVENADLDRLLSIYSSDPAAIDPAGFPVGIGYHHLCTTRMAADPTEGVVDADCRVHDLDNLWIAGSSVFATPATATPTYTVVALAVRLADHLREVLAP